MMNEMLSIFTIYVFYNLNYCTTFNIVDRFSFFSRINWICKRKTTIRYTKIQY